MLCRKEANCRREDRSSVSFLGKDRDAICFGGLTWTQLLIASQTLSTRVVTIRSRPRRSKRPFAIFLTAWAAPPVDTTPRPARLHGNFAPQRRVSREFLPMA